VIIDRENLIKITNLLRCAMFSTFWFLYASEYYMFVYVANVILVLPIFIEKEYFSLELNKFHLVRLITS
jgi:hypothetical protein